MKNRKLKLKELFTGRKVAIVINGYISTGVVVHPVRPCVDILADLQLEVGYMADIDSSIYEEPIGEGFAIKFAEPSEKSPAKVYRVAKIHISGHDMYITDELLKSHVEIYSTPYSAMKNSHAIKERARLSKLKGINANYDGWCD